MRVRDVICNEKFDFNANYAIYEVPQNATWEKGGHLIFSTAKDGFDTPSTKILDMTVKYMTISNNVLVIEVETLDVLSINREGMSLNDFINKLFTVKNTAMVRVFDNDNGADAFLEGDDAGMLFSFQSYMKPEVFLLEKYADAKVKNFYAADCDELYVVIEQEQV